MVGFSGSYLPRPGDHFIFEGGVTWPNSVFPLAVTGSGVAGNDDYYGVNKSWYSGSSWTRPIFNADNAPITAADPNSGGPTAAGANDVYVDLRGNDYITIDNIEFTGFDADSTKATYAYGDCAMIEASSNGADEDQNITIDDIYVHDFYIDKADGYNPGSCFVVQGYTNHAPFSGNSVLESSTIAGDGNTYGAAVWGFGNVESDDIHDLAELLILAGHGQISGNTLYDCGYPSFPTDGGTASHTHNNALETVQSDGAFYIHDNVIYNTGFDSGRNDECEAMFVGNANETDYVWNNVLYDDYGNSVNVDESESPTGAYFWNNTLQGGLGETEPCFAQGHAGTEPTIEIENNLCITGAGDVEGGIAAHALTVRQNVVLGARSAAGDGYTRFERYAYSPRTARSRQRIRTGVNLSGRCLRGLKALCRDTSYGGARSPKVRPRSGAWEIGAY
jgi:hypothetical protein